MSLARPTPQPNTRDFDHVLKALVHLLARQAARELLTPSSTEKEVDNEEDEQGEGTAEAGDPERAE